MVRLYIQDKTILKNRFSNILSKFPNSYDDRVSNPKYQKGRGTSSPSQKPTCRKRGQKHYVDYLVEMNNCCGCGKSGHKVRDSLNVKGKCKGNGKA